jgi:hypothetical protein
VVLDEATVNVAIAGAMSVGVGSTAVGGDVMMSGRGTGYQEVDYHQLPCPGVAESRGAPAAVAWTRHRRQTFQSGWNRWLLKVQAPCPSQCLDQRQMTPHRCGRGRWVAMVRHLDHGLFIYYV